MKHLKYLGVGLLTIVGIALFLTIGIFAFSLALIALAFTWKYILGAGLIWLTYKMGKEIYLELKTRKEDTYKDIYGQEYEVKKEDIN